MKPYTSEQFAAFIETYETLYKVVNKDGDIYWKGGERNKKELLRLMKARAKLDKLIQKKQIESRKAFTEQRTVAYKQLIGVDLTAKWTALSPAEREICRISKRTPTELANFAAWIMHENRL